MVWQVDGGLVTGKGVLLQHISAVFPAGRVTVGAQKHSGATYGVGGKDTYSLYQRAGFV